MSPRRAIRTGRSPGYRRSLWKVSVRTGPEAEEAVSEFLGNYFQQPVTSFHNARSGIITVTVFLQRKPVHFERDRRRIRQALRQIRSLGLDPGAPAIALNKIPRENWAESWKRHFTPLAIGRTLLIRPSWNRCSPDKYQAIVELDPGLSFGTGKHPTTHFCLRQLVLRRKPGQDQSLLDLGTGSGILAIAGAQLGYAPIEAMDMDPDAIQTARANAQKNRVKCIRFRIADLRKLKLEATRTFSVVCANLLGDLLVHENARIVNRLQPKGILIVAGILREEMPLIVRTYGSAGLRLIAGQTRGSWWSGCFGRNFF